MLDTLGLAAEVPVQQRMNPGRRQHHQIVRVVVALEFIAMMYDFTRLEGTA